MRLLMLFRGLLLLAITLLPFLMLPAPGAPMAHARLIPNSPSASAFFWHQLYLYANSSPQRMKAVVFDPETPGLALAASESDFPQRTSDHGVTWWPVLDESLGQDGTTDVVYGYGAGIFYYFHGRGFFKTTDGGQTWSPLVSPSPPATSMRILVVQPSNPQILYVATMEDIVRSLDGGTTWTSPAEACSCAPEARSLAIGTDQPILYAGRDYDRGGGVARSLDQGATWADVATGLPTDTSIVRLIVDPRDADVVYALTEHGEIYRTGNGGVQWTIFTTGLPQDPIQTLALDQHHGYRLFGLTDTTVYTRDDGAPSWQAPALPPLPQNGSFPDPWQLTVDPADANRLLLAGQQGLAASLPVPTITALNQTSTPAGGDSFKLIVTGTNFIPGMTVQLNGISRLTEFVSSQQLAITLTPADLAFPRTFAVVVVSPRDSESGSNSLPFTVAGPALTITRLSPDLRAAGNPAFTLTVQGTEFAPGATLEWHGAARPTTVVSSTLLTAQISAADLARPGAVAITVVNPAPDGRASNTMLFMVAPQASPVARRLRPESETGPVTSVTVTDDGNTVIYSGAPDHAHPQEIYRLPIQGGTPQRINPPFAVGDQLLGHLLTNDQSRIVYMQYISATQQTALYSIPVAGGASTQLNAPLANGERLQHFTVTEDSQRVIYRTARNWSEPSQDSFYVVPVTGGQPTLLFAATAEDQSVSMLPFSHDGAYIVFTVTAGSYPDDTLTIYSVPAAGGSPILIDGPFPRELVGSIQVTPDISTIVYAIRPSPRVPATLYTVPVTGGTPATPFTSIPSLWGNDNVVISPDSRFAIISSAGLYSVRLDGSTPPMLLSRASGTPKITPDSSSVVYSTAMGLYRVPITGGETTQLSLPADRQPQSVRTFYISPDSHQVVYLAYVDEEPYGDYLFSVPIDGHTPAVQISNTRDHGSAFDSNDVFFTPNNRLVLYRVRRGNDNLHGLFATATNGSGPAQNISAPVPMVAGYPIINDPYYGFTITPDGRHAVFLGGEERDDTRDLYITDIPPETAILTSAGGEISFGDLLLTFPANAVATPITLTYTTFSHPTHALEPGRIAVRSFALTAHDGTGQPVSSFAQPYTLRLSYTDAELAALGIDEAGLELAFWDRAAWAAVPPCEGCGVDAATNTITVRLDHMTDFALLGSTNETIFLPLIAR